MKALIATLFFLGAAHGCDVWVPKKAHGAEPGPVSDYALGVLVAASIATMPTWEKAGAATATHLVSFGLNQGLKYAFSHPCRRFAERPNGEDCQGMPSGHAQQGGTAAGIICREHKGVACAGGLALAVGVAGLRVKAGKHDKRQVSAGLGIGVGIGYYGVTASAEW